MLVLPVLVPILHSFLLYIYSNLGMQITFYDLSLIWSVPDFERLWQVSEDYQGQQEPVQMPESLYNVKQNLLKMCPRLYHKLRSAPLLQVQVNLMLPIHLEDGIYLISLCCSLWSSLQAPFVQQEPVWTIKPSNAAELDQSVIHFWVDDISTQVHCIMTIELMKKVHIACVMYMWSTRNKFQLIHDPDILQV